MARKRKPLRPKTNWRYGAHCDEPLFILDDSSEGSPPKEHFVEFVVPITHLEFTVRIRETYHTFVFGKFHAKKIVINDFKWISRVAYQSLVVLADHVMRAHFASFGNGGKASRRPLFVENERVTICRLSRSGVSVLWNGGSYRFEPIIGWTKENTEEPLPLPVCCFFERFYREISPKLPVYRTPEEAEADLIERRLMKTAPATLFREEEVVSVRIVKEVPPKPKDPDPYQPRLI